MIFWVLVVLEERSGFVWVERVDESVKLRLQVCFERMDDRSQSELAIMLSGLERKEGEGEDAARPSVASY